MSCKSETMILKHGLLGGVFCGPNAPGRRVKSIVRMRSWLQRSLSRSCLNWSTEIVECLLPSSRKSLMPPRSLRYAGLQVECFLRQEAGVENVRVICSPSSVLPCTETIRKEQSFRKRRSLLDRNQARSGKDFTSLLLFSHLDTHRPIHRRHPSLHAGIHVAPALLTSDTFGKRKLRAVDVTG